MAGRVLRLTASRIILEDRQTSRSIDITRMTTSPMNFAKLILAWTLFTFIAVEAKEAAAPPRVAANHAAQLKKMIGKTATVHGKVSGTSVSKSGIHFLNLVSSDLVVVCFRENASQFPAGGPAKLFKGKEVEVTGSIALYKNKPQIKITSPKQIQLARSNTKSESKPPSLSDVKVGKTPSLSDVKVGPTTKKFELKQTGKLTWLSPAGLRYSGKDPQGRTRVEHVLRHAADEPRRAGSHGVFDGGNDGTLAVVDEAWRMVKKKKIKPKNEGRTSAYTIPMGRRVGYLGGQNGAKRGKPALKKVFIVVRTDTSDVITAFPK